MVKKRRKVRKKKPADHHNSNIMCGDCAKLEICRKPYRVNEFTNACIYFKGKSTIPIIDNIEDKFIGRLKKRLGSKQFIVDKSILDELNTFKIFCIYSRKKSKVGIVHSFGKKELINLGILMARTQAYRDRTLEIRISIQSILNDLNSMENIARSHVYGKYGNHLSELKTTSIREIKIRSIIRPLLEMKDQIELIIKTAEMVESNLSNTHFALKEIRSVADIVLNKLLSP